MKKKLQFFFNSMISLYLIISTSFFYNQYITVTKVNNSSYSDLIYFIRDNNLMIILFLSIFAVIICNIYHSIDHWIFSTKQQIRTQTILGYTFLELIKSYYFSYILIFSVSFIFSALAGYFILSLLNMYILLPIFIAYIISFFLISTISITMISVSLKKALNNTPLNFKIFKWFLFIMQISISLVLLTVSLMLINDSLNEISPYNYYKSMDKGWIIQRESFDEEKELDIWRNPEKYKKNTLDKIQTIFYEYENNLIINFNTSYSHDELGEIYKLNKKSLDINSIDFSDFKPYLNLEEQPIILNSSFAGKYKKGDIIQNEPINYVVAKIMDEAETIRIVKPNDFGDIPSSTINIALFDNKYIENDLYFENTNFLRYIYIESISEGEALDIVKYISQETLPYEVKSIAEMQVNFNNQRFITWVSYAFVGINTILFSLLGLIFVIYMDIKTNELRFSILKLIGYTNTCIYISYLVNILVLVFTSFTISQIISSYTGALTTTIFTIVLVLILILYGTICFVTIHYMKDINETEIIGGENV